MKKTLIRLGNPLGDALGAMPYLDKYAKESGNSVHVHLNNPIHYQLFEKSYPDIQFVRMPIEADEVIHIDGSGPFDQSLQQGMARQLGYENAPYIRPKCDSFKKERPIKNKFAVIGLHATAQLKYWNHPDGKIVQELSPYWNDLCGKLRKSGITPVVVELHELFGVSPYWNGIPKKAQKKIGLDLPETANYIEHAEFFIGLSSGLSWFAHALGQKVAMISNFTDDFHEFDINCEDYVRITNTNVCHGCWHKIKIDYDFDPGDWYWCPYHKDTNRQFECHTSITPDMVFEKIKHWL